MEENKEKLKFMIASSINVSAERITDDFSIMTSKFRTSAGSVILSNMVKKVYGKKIDCKNIKTFGELVALLETTEPKQDNLNNDADKSISQEEKDISNFYSQDLRGNSLSPTQNTAINSSSFICGIDIQEISIFPKVEDYWTEPFYTDNFTDYEIAYCTVNDSPIHSFAARWCLKEALHKCGEKYYHLPLKDIQIVKSENGILYIEVWSNDEWNRLSLSCSISHADNYAVGMIVGIK